MNDMTFWSLTLIKCQRYSYVEEDVEQLPFNNFAKVENRNT